MKSFWTLILVLFLSGRCFSADFKVLFCELTKTSKGYRLKVLLDNQFAQDVENALKNGMDYLAVLELRNSERVSYKRFFTYDVVDRVYVVREKKRELRIADEKWFQSFSRLFVLDFGHLDPNHLEARVVRKNLGLPFPFNLLPWGSYKTSWVRCKLSE